MFKLEVILDLALVPTDVFKLADYGVAIPRHAYQDRKERAQESARARE